MNEAFFELLSKKDFSYITVKEICEKAKVNRSTFYLHYETIGDLLSESVEYLIKHFMSYMNSDAEKFSKKIESGNKEDMFLITSEYLMPYLNYIKEHKRLFLTAVENIKVLRLDVAYENLFHHIFTPILKAYNVPQKDMEYIMSFYLEGIMAIITRWLKNDCKDPIENIIAIIKQCIRL